MKVLYKSFKIKKKTRSEQTRCFVNKQIRHEEFLIKAEDNDATKIHSDFRQNFFFS